MAYTKTTWQNGDIITSNKLNKMEQGIYNIFSKNIFYIYAEFNIVTQTLTLIDNVTGQQIIDAINNNKIVILKEFEKFEDTVGNISLYYFNGYKYHIEQEIYYFIFGNVTFQASSLSENLTIPDDGSSGDDQK